MTSWTARALLIGILAMALNGEIARAQTSLDVSGGGAVIPGYDSRTCVAGIEGAMRNVHYEGSLVAWWKLDETAGTTAFDSTGNGLNGTMGGGLDGVNDGVQGIIGGALDFSSQNTEFIEMASSTMLDIVNGAVSFWFRTANASDAANRFVFSKDNSGRNAGDFHVRLNTSTNGLDPNEIMLYVDDGVTETYITSDSPIQANSWTHVVVSFGAAGLQMYVNGNKQAETSPATDGMTNPAASVILGNLRNGSSGGFDGALDDVRLYEKQLSGDEISALYAQRAVIQVCTDKLGSYQWTDWGK